VARFTVRAMNEQLAGLRPAHRDALRLVGAVMFATGAVVLFARKDAQDQWAAFPKLLLLAIPCALLYGLGVGAVRIGRSDDDDAPGTDARFVAPWRATALVLGLLLLPIALLQLVDTIGGDPDKSGHTAWVFALTAVAAGYAAFNRGLRWGALFAGIAVIISWIALWDALVEPSATAIRWLFLIIGALLVLAATRLDDTRRREQPELITAAGIAGVAAGVTAILAVASQLIGAAVATAFGSEPDLSGTQQRQEWDVFLLLLALALIWYGNRAAWRGPVYVGGLALFVFIVSVSAEFTAIFSGDGPSGDVMGWPLLLLVLGGAGLLAGLFGGGGRTTTAPATAGTGPDPAAPTEQLPPTPPPGSPPPGQP
jgi:hypothetical protein